MDARTVLIDTSLFIEHIRSRDKSSTTLARIHRQRHSLVTSSIVAAELCYGSRTQTMRADVMTLLSIARIIPFGQSAAFRISLEVARLKQRNAVIGFRDLAIACTALEESLPVATLNMREFGRIEGLELLSANDD